MEESRVTSNSIKKNMFWKLLERFGVQAIQFVLQIILARILDPEHYGMLSIMIVFINLANVFIQYGFNTSLIQNKDVTEDDYSSVFWVSLIIAAIVYVIIFFTSPLIGKLYESQELVKPLQVLAIMIIPGAFNSIQIAKISRKMEFKKIFFGNIIGIFVSGVISVILAYNGAGLWSLVAQTLINSIVTCIVMFIITRWKPKFKIDFVRIKSMFSYGWKLLVSGLIDVSYNEARSMIIGYKYDKDTLGYYSRGKQFPQFIINGVNGAVQSVMLPALSSVQDDKKEVKQMMRKSVMLNCYIIFPIMAGLAAVAPALVEVLLTKKWIDCVPYLQIYCFTYAFWPVHSCNLQAMNAVGRSDLFLKLEIIKKTIGIVSIVIALLCFDTPMAIAMTGVFTTFTSTFINAFPNKKLIGYSYLEQFKDILPSLLSAIVMCGSVYLFNFVINNLYLLLVVQLFVGVLVYLLLSVVFKLTPFKMLIQNIKNKKSKVA